MKVTVYSKRDCHLCEEALQALRRLQGQHPFELEALDITEDQIRLKRYEQFVPAIFIDGAHTYSYHLDEADFLQRLRAQS